MGFQSIDELDNFSYEDCQIEEFQVNDDGIELVVEALIVNPNNSQNTNYTRSYAGTARIRLQGGHIGSAFKEGFRYYNADDVLVSQTPDEALSLEEIKTFPKKCKGAYLFAVKKHDSIPGKQEYAFGIEFADDSDYGSNVSDTYQLNISFDKSIVNWDRYMNRVENYG